MKRWTTEEEALLREVYPLYGAQRCAELLERPAQAVRLKASRLKIKTTLGYSNERYILELKERNPKVVSIEPYIDSLTCIAHKCLKCSNIWNTKPKTALEGYGCPKCSARIDLSVPTNLYLVSFVLDEIKYYKIGITKNEPRKRYLAEWNKLNMKVEWVINFATGYEAKKVEQQLLKDNDCYKIDTGALAGGNTETVSVYVSKPNGIKRKRRTL